MKSIPVYSGLRIVDLCDDTNAQRYVGAKNVEVIRERSGRITQIKLIPHADESDLNSIHLDSRRAHYTEHFPDGRELATLKRIGAGGGLVSWSGREGFRPGRFNPDRMVPA